MLVQGIKSRPVYPGFDLSLPARRRLIALQGEGARAILDRVSPGDTVLATAEILYTGPDAEAAALGALDPARFWHRPSVETLIDRLDAILATATMSTRLYAAGTEPFIGAVLQAGAAVGIKHQSIGTEHRGSLVRRVQCVHCKGFTDGVTTSPVPCSHCGLHLLVRDHFSRRFNAFQGVCVNAEEPDVVPEPEELFA